MASDIGVVNNDSDDSVPNSPLDSITGLTPVRARKRKIKLLKNFDNFNPDLKIEERVTKRRDSWWGVISDVENVTVIDKKKYYEVQLQDGQFVQAYYPDQVDTHEWKDYQRVHVIHDGTDYIILTPPSERNAYLWWEATETLTPGGTAKGKIRYYDNDLEEFKDNSSEVEIKDIEYRNFILRGERIQVRNNYETYEPIGSFGLLRKAKTKVQITSNGSGLVSVYANSIIAQEPHEGADRDVEVTVHLNWASGNRPFQSSREIFIQYFTDEKKWVIVGGEC